MIISIHSFRGGTGKSNTTANVSALMAQRGYRVGVIDTDIQSPGIHVLFGLDESQIQHSLNDYLWGKCPIDQAAYDVTRVLTSNPKNGKLYLIPSSIKTNEIARILREGYDPAALSDGYTDLLEALKLDYLIIDTHPGLNEETLLSIAISDVLVIIMRPDSQDYQGTGVTVEVARKLRTAKLLLVVNKVPLSFGLEDVKRKIAATYQCEVAAVFPHSDELMALASSGIFSMQYPTHPMTSIYQELVAQLVG
ncbi:MAG: MinD/ParA family protein [Caldilineaceae bacterium]|nr:MinD/ParA family protein [Caldilineaceae bacterium]